MRKRKFRAWDKELKFMVDISKYHIAFNGDIFFNNNGDLINQTEKLEIIEFTGLLDKNGKEIYEGDIVKLHYFIELGSSLGVTEGEKEIIGQISLQELGLWIECSTEEDSGYLLWINGMHEESLEIIGNIYETPNLLNP